MLFIVGFSLAIKEMTGKRRIDMTEQRFRFNIRHLLLLTVAMAGLSALVVSFGPHFLWASKHIIVQRFSAMAKIDNESVVSDCELSTCTFNGLSFDVPTSMIGTARIVRSSPKDVWLAFEDSTRMLSIPLLPVDMRATMVPEPYELRDLSLPQLLEKVVSAASGDFSLGMSKSELGIHDWAMETRRMLQLDSQKLDRYSLVSQHSLDAVLISADPASIDSNRRVRSILSWESADRQKFGSIWFGDSRKVAVGWIDAVARSLELVSRDQLIASELQTLSDEELLSRLSFSEVNDR